MDVMDWGKRPARIARARRARSAPPNMASRSSAWPVPASRNWLTGLAASRATAPCPGDGAMLLRARSNCAAPASRPWTAGWRRSLCGSALHCSSGWLALQRSAALPGSPRCSPCGRPLRPEPPCRMHSLQFGLRFACAGLYGFRALQPLYGRPRHARPGAAAAQPRLLVGLAADRRLPGGRLALRHLQHDGQNQLVP